MHQGKPVKDVLRIKETAEGLCHSYVGWVSQALLGGAIFGPSLRTPIAAAFFS